MITTASEFVAALKEAANRKTLYVMGCFGAPMTEANKQRYIHAEGYNSRPDRREKILDASADTFGFDCVCLIKGILWGWCADPDDLYGGADYLTDIVPDLDAEQMVDVCHDISTDFSRILPGEVVGMPGHIGVYVGEGLCIECTPRWRDCVQYTACANLGQVSGYPGREWVRHGRLPYLDYDTMPELPDAMEVRYDTVDELPGYSKNTIRKLMEKGYLQGRGDGSLDLSEDMIRILVILDRTGIFDGKTDIES